MSHRLLIQAQYFSVTLALNQQEVEACQALRHRVFVEEMGAQVGEAPVGEVGRPLERDYFDDFCHHLYVRHDRSGEVVACTRILTDTQSRLAGGFYSAGEFDLGPIQRLPGRLMEVGRTCVAAEYRSGGVIGLLWNGLARFMDLHRFGYMFGCASIPLAPAAAATAGGEDAGTDPMHETQLIMDWLRRHHFAPAERLSHPNRPLPGRTTLAENLPARMRLPPLLKAYLRLGAEICGEACWDPDFNVADVLILVDVRRIDARYWRHFLKRVDRSAPDALALGPRADTPATRLVHAG